MSACQHEGASPVCPLCAIGEGFTEAGQAALDKLGVMMAGQPHDPAAAILGYARQCVLDREWTMAWNRLHQRNVDDGQYDSSGMLRSARGLARTRKASR